MRSIGLPEMLIISFVELVSLVLPVAVTAVIVWMIAKRQWRAVTLASKKCAYCQQSIPDIGAFCPVCGQKLL